MPASWTATVALKPSNGRIAINPPYFGRVAGPMTRTVADTALLMSVLAKFDRDDFMETPPPKYFRLRPGGEVRLKYAFIIRCDEVVKDAAGQVTELRCSADIESRTEIGRAHV